MCYQNDNFLDILFCIKCIAKIFNNFIFFNFIFWLCWIFVAPQAFFWLWKKSCSGFSLLWLLLWWNTGSRARGLVAKVVV